MKLKKVSKPNDVKPADSEAMIAAGHTVKGYYAEDGDEYYEHDECCDRWYLLDYEDDDE